MSTESEPLLTANRLSILSGLDRRTVEKRLLTATPAKEDRRGRQYRLADALPLLCQAPDNAETERRILDSREREAAARAESAEMDNLEKAKKVCALADAKLFVSETRIAIRRAVERAEYMTPTQKTRLLKQFAEIKIEPPKAGN